MPVRYILLYFWTHNALSDLLALLLLNEWNYSIYKFTVDIDTDIGIDLCGTAQKLLITVIVF